MYFWLCWIFVAAWGFALVAVSRGYSLVVVHGVLVVVTSLLFEHGCGLSSCVSWGPKNRLSSCGTWT